MSSLLFRRSLALVSLCLLLCLCLFSPVSGSCSATYTDAGWMCFDDGDCMNSDGSCISNYIVCVCMPNNPGNSASRSDPISLTTRAVSPRVNNPFALYAGGSV